MSRSYYKQSKTGGKRVASGCQNNHGCNYCRDNRTINNLKRLARTKEQMKILKDEFKDGPLNMKHCPLCNSQAIKELAYNGWVTDFTCLKCGHNFQFNYGDRQGGGVDTIWLLE